MVSLRDKFDYKPPNSNTLNDIHEPRMLLPQPNATDRLAKPDAENKMSSTDPHLSLKPQLAHETSKPLPSSLTSTVNAIQEKPATYPVNANIKTTEPDVAENPTTPSPPSPPPDPILLTSTTSISDEPIGMSGWDSELSDITSSNPDDNLSEPDSDGDILPKVFPHL
jgi:hypothetical protein